MAGDKPEPTPQAPAAPSSEQLADPAAVLGDVALRKIGGTVPVDDFNLFAFSVDEMAQWRKDAERYRWLREHLVFLHCADDDIDAGNFAHDWDDEAAHLDCAIDAAIECTGPFEWPKQICTAEELEVAKRRGKPIEGRDGEYLVRGYLLAGKVYLTAFEQGEEWTV